LGGAETPIDNRSRDKIDMKVWVDQDLCTGDGLCAEIAPDIFEMHDDGLAYVKEVGWPTMYGAAKGEPVYKMATGSAGVPEEHLEAVIESAEECPGECIFIDVDE
jgi:ferredoxin